jgi:hypothetical protein
VEKFGLSWLMGFSYDSNIEQPRSSRDMSTC